MHQKYRLVGDKFELDVKGAARSLDRFGMAAHIAGHPRDVVQGMLLATSALVRLSRWYGGLAWAGKVVQLGHTLAFQCKEVLVRSRSD